MKANVQELIDATKLFLVDDVTCVATDVEVCNHCGSHAETAESMTHWPGCRAVRLRKAIADVEDAGTSGTPHQYHCVLDGRQLVEAGMGTLICPECDTGYIPTVSEDETECSVLWQQKDDAWARCTPEDIRKAKEKANEESTA